MRTLLVTLLLLAACGDNITATLDAAAEPDPDTSADAGDNNPPDDVQPSPDAAPEVPEVDAGESVADAGSPDACPPPPCGGGYEACCDDFTCDDGLVCVPNENAANPHKERRCVPGHK